MCVLPMSDNNVHLQVLLAMIRTSKLAAEIEVTIAMHHVVASDYCRTPACFDGSLCIQLWVYAHVFAEAFCNSELVQ